MTPHPQSRSPDEFDVEIDSDSVEAVTLAFQARHARRLFVSSGVVALGFAAILVWSLGDPAESSVDPLSARSVVETPVLATSPNPEIPTPAAQAIRVELPRRLVPLKSLQLTELRADGSTTKTRLDEVLREGVTVVNLWATYCEPCMREVSVFRAAAQEARDARFVFAMVEGPDPENQAQATALAELRRVAPRTRLLADPTHEIGRVLRSAGLSNGLLPITLVLRCGEIAWGQVGEVRLADLQPPLAAQQKLGRCERGGRPVATPEAKLAPTRPDACGDGTCDRLAGETCASCTADCGCTNGSCVRNTAGTMHCARDLSKLKD
jgi:thiol-disulfide isomerase/thioredoxin